jgi:hypothetical protein
MKKFVVALAFLAAGGCVTLRSNTASESVPAFSQVLVVVKAKRNGDRYASQYRNAFPAGYQVTTIGFDDLSFDKPDSLIAAEARRSGSEVLLWLELRTSDTAVRTGRYPVGPGYEWYAEMRSLRTNQAFWKAETGLLSSYTPPEPRFIVNRLRRDGILQKTAPVLAKGASPEKP